MSASAIRNTLYRITRPCWRGEDCPHDRVTAFRREDVDRVLVSERMDASEDVLDKHYDRRSSRQKAAQ
jgi:hypothetical protein